LTSEGRAAATVGKVRAGAAAALEEAAGQRDRRGRRTLLAALLLAELDDASRLDLLVEAAKPDQPAAIRAHAVHAIGRLGGTDHVPVLAELLKDPEVSVYAYDALRRMSERGLAAAEQPASTYVGQRPPKPLPRP
jgi:HEAT repeat protein